MTIRGRINEVLSCSLRKLNSSQKNTNTVSSVYFYSAISAQNKNAPLHLHDSKVGVEAKKYSRTDILSR